jgi:hypothetical protein
MRFMSGQPNRIRLLVGDEIAPDGCVLIESHVPYLGQVAVFRVAVPADPARLQDAAGLARAICDELVRRIIRGVEDAGGKITCSKGCGACCSSYLVPLTVPEALTLWIAPSSGMSILRVTFAFSGSALEHMSLTPTWVKSTPDSL